MPCRLFGVNLENTTSDSTSTYSTKRKEPEGSSTDPIIVEDDHDVARNPNVVNQRQNVIVVEDDNDNPQNPHNTCLENRNVRQRTSPLGNPSFPTMPEALQANYPPQEQVLMIGSQALVPIYVLSLPVYQVVGNALMAPINGQVLLPLVIVDAMAFILDRAPQLLSRVDAVVQSFVDGRIGFDLAMRLLDYLQNCAMILENNDDHEGYEEDSDHIDIEPDELTYEELLALEEQIGDVSTGLSEEQFEMRIRYRYKAPKNNSQEEVGCCSICLEDFKSRVKIGALDCGHEFHFQCVKQWIRKKNICPVCKKTGLKEP